MTPGNPHDSEPRSIVHLMLGLLMVGLVGGSAYAEDHYYVLRDGRKITATRSDSELGVIFHSGHDTKAARRRVERSSRGTLEDLPGMRGGRAKILRVGHVTAAQREAVLADPDVREVGRVYRFATSTMPVISVGRIVVKLRDDLSEPQRKAIWKDFGLKKAAPFQGLHDVYVAIVAGPLTDDIALCEKLSSDERVRWANPDFLRAVAPQQVIPSDAFFGKQWHLNNTGQTPNGLVDADIDAPEAWTIADGDGVLFGMFDDSCDITHEDLAANYIGTGQDILGPGGCSDTCFFANDAACDDGGQNSASSACALGTDCTDCGERPAADPSPRDFNDFHGTAVMGLAVAAGNALGVRGVSFRSRFTASRGLNQFVFDSQIASAFTFAMEQGVDVHVNSWGLVPGIGSVPDPPILADAIDTAFREGRDLDGEGGDPPRGMVIFFSAGNGDATGNGIENRPGFALSAMPSVLSVGASDDRDARARFSNFGSRLAFLAPGAEAIATVDNQDTDPGPGLNKGGILVDPDFGFALGGNDIDPNGLYTGNFSGTSASCPIAAGVAGLILSVNPQLTATDVRLVMEHTTDQVSPDDAEYNRITSRSLTYGFGRINANSAVLAAQESLTNGGLTWPDVATDLSVIGSTLLWRAGFGTTEFLVVEANADFGFIPEDGVCYDARQSECVGSPIASLPDGVSVAQVGCTNGDCSLDSRQSLDFVQPDFGRKFFAIYARNSVGRYSFGVSVDSTSAMSGGAANPEPIRPPAVTVFASPLEGLSPLTVTFMGNASSQLEINGNQTTWDFDIDDDNPADVTGMLETTHTYVAGAGETRRFTALLTMVDVAGNQGSAVVRIRVEGPPADTVETAPPAGIRILVDGEVSSDDARCQSEICGVSPLAVVLSLAVEGSSEPFTLQSVFWDLGDGAVETSQSAFHRYINEGRSPLVVSVGATVTLTTPAGTTRATTATQTITVLPGTVPINPMEPVLEGTQTVGGGSRPSACGALTLIPLFVGLLSLLFLRRLRG